MFKNPHISSQFLSVLRKNFKIQFSRIIAGISEFLSYSFTILFWCLKNDDFYRGKQYYHNFIQNKRIFFLINSLWINCGEKQKWIFCFFRTKFLDTVNEEGRRFYCTLIFFLFLFVVSFLSYIAKMTMNNRLEEELSKPCNKNVSWFAQ